MATEYQYIDYTMTPIYSSTSGIASPPSIITKDNSMDMANPSAAKKLYLSNQDSPYYNPNFMGSYPISTKTIPYTPNPVVKQPVKKPTIVIQRQYKSNDNMLLLALLVFVLFVLFMSK
jgi:hypothetical protein